MSLVQSAETFYTAATEPHPAFSPEPIHLRLGGGVDRGVRAGVRREIPLHDMRFPDEVTC
jgi:hypothetical protein